MLTIRSLSLFAGLLVFSMHAATLARGQTPTPGPAGVADVEYRIGPEDSLSIVVWKNETLSRTVIVRPDGKISLPLVNDVLAAGRTAMELREDLTKKLSAFMPPPEVSVIVNEAKPRTFHISVLGEVQKPGRYDLKERTTVLEAIALAGGFKDFASSTKIVILREVGGSVRRIPFNYKRAATGEADNFDVMPNDIIMVAGVARGCPGEAHDRGLDGRAGARGYRASRRGAGSSGALRSDSLLHDRDRWLLPDPFRDPCRGFRQQHFPEYGPAVGLHYASDDGLPGRLQVRAVHHPGQLFVRHGSVRTQPLARQRRPEPAWKLRSSLSA